MRPRRRDWGRIFPYDIDRIFPNDRWGRAAEGGTAGLDVLIWSRPVISEDDRLGVRWESGPVGAVVCPGQQRVNRVFREFSGSFHDHHLVIMA
jgi:hypothetical protein